MVQVQNKVQRDRHDKTRDRDSKPPSNVFKYVKNDKKQKKLKSIIINFFYQIFM